MHAIQISTCGDPSVLELVELPIPTPGELDVIVGTRAIGVNFVDLQHRAGHPYPVRLPLIPGIEASGVVHAVGSHVTGGHMGGVYAQYVRVPQHRLVRLPHSIDFETAAAICLQGMTAHVLTTLCHPITAKETVLIHAAAGGVGSLLTQTAKQRGATVIGVTSSPSKRDAVLEFGADHVIMGDSLNVITFVNELTNNQGVDVVFDGVGQATFASSLASLKTRGHLVLYGQSSGAIPPFDLNELSGITGGVSRGSLTVTWAAASHYLEQSEMYEAAVQAVMALAEQGSLVAHIADRFPLAEAEQAHRRLEERSVIGKLLLIP
jgi:NADPH:quinone reductase